MCRRDRFLWVAGLALLGLLGSLGGARAPQASAEQPVRLPEGRELVEQAPDQPWSQTPGLQPRGQVAALVYLDMPPLALVGRSWDQPRRRAYLAQIGEAQARIAPQIAGLGGQVLGRLAHVTSAVAVRIDASRLAGLRALSGVVAARQISNYRLDSREAAAWAGARAAQQRLGLSGQGVNVAVIDTGVDYTHRKLGGPGTPAAYARAYCGDPQATPDPDSPACAAFAQADTSGAFPNAVVRGGFDWLGEHWPDGDMASDPNPIDRAGHGTHVADIIAGRESAPGAGDAGLAPGASIWAYKACSARSGVCNGLALLLAIDDAMDLDDSDYGACTVGRDPGCRDYDPADIINLSIGAAYGQPEDDLSLFVNMAGYYGSLVVAAAGNTGDRPYSVSSPSTADAALSVAESGLPSQRLYRIDAGGQRAGGLHQPWSAPVGAPVSGTLVYGDGAGGNPLGCAPFAPGGLAGRVVLLDRGACAVSQKGAHAAAAGAALVIVADNQPANTPPTFLSAGEAVDIPLLTVTEPDGQRLRGAAGSLAGLAPDQTIGLGDDIVSSSSRGPRIGDSAIKPDLAAPGGGSSAQVGTGDGQSSFGGTSGAAPVVSGAAALLVERLRQRGLLDQGPGLARGGSPSLAPLVKAALMNTARPDLLIGGAGAEGGSGFLAPITLQGAGRVDALAAAEAGTLAWDITELRAVLSDPQAAPACRIDRGGSPVERIMRFVSEGIPPACAEPPFGNRFFNAWNRQTGSLSFGYQAVADQRTLTRTLAVQNQSGAARHYQLRAELRYANDQDRGVSIQVAPAQLDLAPGQAALVEVTLQIDAGRLRDWSLSAGSAGGSGTNIFCDNPNPQQGCPNLSLFEYDGFVTVDGGPGNLARLPWQVLPRRVAQTAVAGLRDGEVEFRNPAPSKSGDVDVFALIDVSPNQCDLYDREGNCITSDYTPGLAPGINSSPIDLKEIGVRSRVAPGLNAGLGLPEQPDGAVPDELVEFALTVYDAPYRSAHNQLVEFNVAIDADGDGQDDYVVFNNDLNRDGSDGRSAVFVADVNPADGTRPTRPYLFSVTDINTQNWILPVPAAALGLASTRPFQFRVFAFDTYYGGKLWDCAPRSCFDRYTYQTGLPRARAVTTSLSVPQAGLAWLAYRVSSEGAAASPSQQGLLFLYRDAEVERGSEHVWTAEERAQPSEQAPRQHEQRCGAWTEQPSAKADAPAQNSDCLD